jgi:hypothetical protein
MPTPQTPSGVPPGVTLSSVQGVPPGVTLTDLNSAPTQTPPAPGLLDKIRNNVATAQQGAQPGDGGVVGALKNFGAGGADVVRSLGHAAMHPLESLTPSTPQQGESNKPVSQQLKDSGSQIASDASNVIHNPMRTAGRIGTGLLAGEAGGAALRAGAEVPNLIPTRAKAGAMFDSLNKDLANQPVNLTRAAQPLQRVTEIGERGSTLPAPVNKLLQRSQGVAPMTFPEARDYQGSLSDLSASDKLAMNGRVRGGVAQLNKSLYDDLHDAASQAGRGDDYAKAMTDYRRASQIRNTATNVGNAVKKVAIPAVVGAGLYKFAKEASQ